MRRAAPFIAIFLVQALCAIFFVSDILTSVLGIQTTPLSWELRELMEIGASLGLVLGVVVGGMMLRRGPDFSAMLEPVFGADGLRGVVPE